MINLLINGANGRMGKKVLEASLKCDNIKACCGVDIACDCSNPNYPIYDSFDKVTQKIDVIIDFSAPATLDKVLEYCSKNNIPAVLCATGYSEQQIAKIKEYSSRIALFRSGNMSLGVNVLIDLVKKATAGLEDFDVEIIEKHHNQKVDAPSGTALMLADAVKDVDDQKFYTYGREGIVGKRDPNEIGIHAVRGGGIVGEHQVIFASNFETITLTHQATDRSVFADGAIKAALYITTKKTGLYNMNDVINQK
ncbi:MAG: 4-hydroxy-tetrahydrodipicolinate reductase [Clostridiales bacterium]|nr:4-hydroxy-tetrahydrodipicolinate reductase [Clostridiales bacterium]